MENTIYLPDIKLIYCYIKTLKLIQVLMNFIIEQKSNQIFMKIYGISTFYLHINNSICLAY